MTKTATWIAVERFVCTLVVLWLWTGVCHAQMGMPGRSLGGYGAATIDRYYQDRQGAWIPYNGGFGGFVPYQYLEPRSALGTMPSPRVEPTTIGGTGAIATPIGGASRRMNQGRLYAPLNLGEARNRGMSPRGGPRNQMRSLGFGSPFRTPPSLVGGGSGAAMGSM